MKKSVTNSKNTVSKTEKGLKHLRLVGVGREYIEECLAHMQNHEPKTLQSKAPSNGRKAKK